MTAIEPVVSCFSKALRGTYRLIFCGKYYPELKYPVQLDQNKIYRVSLKAKSSNRYKHSNSISPWLKLHW
jgi:hypothetical protein